MNNLELFHITLAKDIFDKCTDNQKMRVIDQTRENMGHWAHDTAEHIRTANVTGFEKLLMRYEKDMSELHKLGAEKCIESQRDITNRRAFVVAIKTRLQLHVMHDKVIKEIQWYCKDGAKPLVYGSILQVKPPTTVVHNQETKKQAASYYDWAMGHLAPHRSPLISLIYISVILLSFISLGVVQQHRYKSIEMYTKDGASQVIVMSTQVGGALFNIAARNAPAAVFGTEDPVLYARIGALIIALGLMLTKGARRTFTTYSHLGLISWCALYMFISSIAMDLSTQADYLPADLNQFGAAETTDFFTNLSAKTKNTTRAAVHDEFSRYDMSGLEQLTKLNSISTGEVCMDTLCSLVKTSKSVLKNVIIESSSFSNRDILSDKGLAGNRGMAVELQRRFTQGEMVILNFHAMMQTRPDAVVNKLGDILKTEEMMMSTVWLGAYGYHWATSVLTQTTPAFSVQAGAAIAAVTWFDEFMTNEHPELWPQTRDHMRTGAYLMWTLVARSIEPRIKKVGSFFTTPAAQYILITKGDQNNDLYEIPDEEVTVLTRVALTAKNFLDYMMSDKTGGKIDKFFGRLAREKEEHDRARAERAAAHRRQYDEDKKARVLFPFPFIF